MEEVEGGKRGKMQRRGRERKCAGEIRKRSVRKLARLDVPFFKTEGTTLASVDTTLFGLGSMDYGG